MKKRAQHSFTQLHFARWSLASQVVCLITVLTVFLVPGQATVRAETRQAAALVTNTQGDVQIAPQGSRSWAPLKLLSEVAAGDTIQVSKKGQARLVFYHDTHSEILKEGCVVKVSPKSCILEKGKPGSITQIQPYKGVRAFQSIEASKEKFGGVVVRGGVSGNEVHLERPVGTITSLRPLFQWEAIGGAEDYLVKLEDENWETIWEVPSRSNSLPYPESSQSLTPGATYFWKVGARQNQKVKAWSEDGTFATLSLETQERLRALKEQTDRQIRESPGDPAPYVVLLTFYMEHNLLEDALQACSTLSQMIPGDKSIHYWKGTLYNGMGMKEKAKEEYKKAGTPQPGP